MYESDQKIIDYIKNILIKLFNAHRDSGKVFFQIKVPVLEVLAAYELIYKKTIRIGSEEDKDIILRFETSLNSGMDAFERHCKEKGLSIKKIREDSELYYEYDKRSKKLVRQDKSLKMILKGNKITFNELDRLYDCAAEFKIRISTDQIKDILEKNPSLAHDLFRWGDDTEVGDSFYQAFVEKITGRSLRECKELFKDNFYKEVEERAIALGYQKHRETEDCS